MPLCAVLAAPPASPPFHGPDGSSARPEAKYPLPLIKRSPAQGVFSVHRIARPISGQNSKRPASSASFSPLSQAPPHPDDPASLPVRIPVRTTPCVLPAHSQGPSFPDQRPDAGADRRSPHGSLSSLYPRPSLPAPP